MAAQNLFQQYLQPPRSVADYTADMDAADLRREQLRGAVNTNALNALTTRQTADTIQQNSIERAALRSAAQQAGGDRDRLIGLMRASGMPGLMTQADALEKGGVDVTKGRAAAAKDNAEAAGTDQKTAESKRQAAMQVIASINSPSDAIALVQRGAQAGSIPPDIAPALVKMIQTDPKWQLKLMMTVGNPDETRKLLTPHLGTTNTGGQTLFTATDQITGATTTTGQVANTQSPDNRATVGATVRGQDITDSRERGAVQYETDGTGNLVAVPKIAPKGAGPLRGAAVLGADGKPVPGKDGGLNDSQSKALLFGTRMRESDAILAKMAQQGVTQPGAIKRVAEAGGNLLGLGTDSAGGALSDLAGKLTNGTQSSGQQQVEQAQRDFVNAVLRRESGASISPTEFRSAALQYFPQPGDGEAVLAQKARNRSTAIAGMMAEVPQNKRALPGVGGAPGAPAGGGGVVDWGSLK